jgi:hypothetical protein
MSSPRGEVHAPFLWSITMSLDLETVPETAVQGDLLEAAASLSRSACRTSSEFGDELLDSLNRANPPVYTGQARAHRQLVLASLKRKLFQAQADVVHAVTELLVDRGERAAIVNGEMGCGKTTVGIATAAVLNAEGYRRTLVLSPPHLVYKWRREIQETVAGAKVWVLNGPDTLVKLSSCASSWACPRARSSSSWAACGCGWGSTGSPSSPGGARRTATWGLPGLRACHHRPRRRADQPGRTRSRGVPPQVQPLRAPLWTLIRPEACPPATSPRPCSKP